MTAETGPLELVPVWSLDKVMLQLQDYFEAKPASKNGKVKAVRAVDAKFFYLVLQIVDIFARWAKLYIIGMEATRYKMWKSILTQMSIGRRWFKFLRFSRSIPDLLEDRSKLPTWKACLEQTEVAADMLGMISEDNNSLYRMGIYKLMGLEKPWMKARFQWIENRTWNLWTIIAVPVAFMGLNKTMEKYKKAKEDNAEDLPEVKEKLILSVGKCIKACCELLESSHDCEFINMEKTSIVCGMISGMTSFYKAISRARRMPE